MIEFARLHREAKSSHWLDPVVERILEMSRRHGGAGPALADAVWILYAQRAPALGLWAILEDGRLVGHMLAQIQQWDGEWVAWVHQLEHDFGPPATQETWDRGLAELIDWAEAFNFSFKNKDVQVRRFMMSTPWNERFWTRRAGFRAYRTIMDRPIGEGHN